MGQQQLLLLVLSVILVGLAVLGGISVYNQSVRKTRTDVATARAVEIVGRMQVWVRTPQAMGGAEGTGNPWANFRLQQMGIQPAGVCTNGREFVRLADGSQISIFGDGGNPVDGGIVAWHPNGDCGTRWNWEFHIVSQSASLEGIQFVQCASGLRSWADGSQCARW